MSLRQDMDFSIIKAIIIFQNPIYNIWIQPTDPQEQVQLVCFISYSFSGKFLLFNGRKTKTLISSELPTTHRTVEMGFKCPNWLNLMAYRSFTTIPILTTHRHQGQLRVKVININKNILVDHGLDDDEDDPLTICNRCGPSKWWFFFPMSLVCLTPRIHWRELVYAASNSLGQGD